MNGTGRISWNTLTNFLNDSEAPPGYVCFIDNEPAIQIDLFEGYYTLFWLGSTDVGTFVSVFAHVIDEVKSERPLRSWLAPKPSFEGFASVIIDRVKISMTLRYPPEKPRYYKKSEPISSSDTQTIYTLKDRLYPFVEPDISSTVSIHCELKTTLRNKDYQLALWADTKESRKENKETGITSNLPITQSLEGLISRTSPAAGALASSDFDELMKEIRANISPERRYY